MIFIPSTEDRSSPIEPSERDIEELEWEPGPRGMAAAEREYRKAIRLINAVPNLTNQREQENESS